VSYGKQQYYVQPHRSGKLPRRCRPGNRGWRHELSFAGETRSFRPKAHVQSGDPVDLYAGHRDVTATSAGLGNGTASFTVYPVPPRHRCRWCRPAALSAKRAATEFRIRQAGRMVQYYLSGAAKVSVDVVDASGRISCEDARITANARLASCFGPGRGNCNRCVRCAVHY